MTLINTVAVIVLAMVLFATVCSGKGNFDDIDSSGSGNCAYHYFTSFFKVNRHD